MSDNEFDVLDSVVRWDVHAAYSLRAPGETELHRAIGVLGAMKTAADHKESRAALDLLRVAARDALRAALYLGAAARVLGSALDDEWDTLADEQRERIRLFRVDTEPRVGRLEQLLQDMLADLVGRPLDLVVGAGVDDLGHGAAPSVGAGGGGSSSVTESTVGVGPDAPAQASPSPAGASALDLASDMAAVVRRDVMDVPRLASALYAMGWRRP